jgi:hypothetical protein
MSTNTITRVSTLPDSAAKADFHNLVDTATVAVSDVVNADISSSAAIVDTKLATISTAGKVNISALIATNQGTGDTIYFNGTSWVRLGVGTTGQTLTVAGGLPSWA